MSQILDLIETNRKTSSEFSALSGRLFTSSAQNNLNRFFIRFKIEEIKTFSWCVSQVSFY